MGKLMSRECNLFYIDRIEICGYKLKVKVDVNKFGVVGVFMWVFIVVMRGKYDVILIWFFEKKVRLMVID